ncbi:hypothetical protein [Thiomicrorhabdus indica]|uniref:hypothetical protein n=1 Tax=Thiomicrorhabdus indica TaxID=2267253 RepID=UPI00102D6F9D|nr:hypothetical protein [Thiomicrorhabdus indica]
MEISEIKPITDEEVIERQNNLSTQLKAKNRWFKVARMGTVILGFWAIFNLYKQAADFDLYELTLFSIVMFALFGFVSGFLKDERDSLQRQLDSWERRTKKLNKESNEYLNYLKLVNQIPELKDFHKALNGEMPRVIDLEKVKEVETRLKLHQEAAERNEEVADLEKRLG